MLGRSKSSGAFPQPWEAAGAVAVMAALFVFSAMPTPVLAGLAPAPGIEVAARPTGDIPTDERWGGKPSPLILRAQKALSDLGVYRGPLDGRMDVATKSAIQAYQRGAGLKADGRLTEELVENLENSIQVRVLLRRLEKVRIENISAARKALLGHPATRDLVTGEKQEVADPTRDKTTCFENLTVRCLLDEALDSAKAVFKPELRDWALGEILVAQARAGLRPEAMQTAGRIRDPRLIVVALRDIAEAQAASGLSEEALAAAGIIPNPKKNAEALAAIADIQVKRGDKNDALATVGHLLYALPAIDDSLTRISLQARAAVILAKSGNAPQASDILAKAESFSRANISGNNLGIALRHIAKGLAETQQLAQAMTILSDVTDDSNRTPVLIAAATQQVLAGDMAAALATADTIEGVRYRAVVLGRIALSQAEADDLDAAEVTLETALAAIDKIKLPYARSYAVSRVSIAMAGIGKAPQALDKSEVIFQKAAKTALGIDDNRLRAHTLWTIAAEQIRAGDESGARKTKTLAKQATGEIKSSLSQVWMFSEIAAGHATEGEDTDAWAAFDQGVLVARTIDNAWGRARAFGKLAATLIELINPGKGLSTNSEQQP